MDWWVIRAEGYWILNPMRGPYDRETAVAAAEMLGLPHEAKHVNIMVEYTGWHDKEDVEMAEICSVTKEIILRGWGN